MRANLTRQGVSFQNKSSRNCCVPVESETSIPFSSIIDAVPRGDDIELTFLTANGSNSVVETSKMSITSDEDDITEFILAQSFPGPRRTRLYVLINPHGGTGDAEQKFNTHALPVFERAKAQLTIVKTTHSGHARELALNLDIDHFDAIVCVSGDGLPHEVLNGFTSRSDAEKALKLPLCQLPGGSGNAMCYSLNGTGDWGICALNIVKAAPVAFDLMRVSQGNQVFYSFLSQSFGIVADCDLGTEHWRWMGGFRFTVGAVLKSLSANTYPANVAYKVHEEGATYPYNGLQHLYGSVNDPIPEDWKKESHPNLAMFYVGKMPSMSADAIVFPYAAPSDGTMDMIQWNTDVGRVKSLNFLDKMQTAAHVKDPTLRYVKIVAYRLTPNSANYLSIDGESYPSEPFQVEILPKAATLLSPSGNFAYQS